MATDLKFCPQCGAKITATDQTCPRCHTDLRPFREVKQPQVAPAKPKLNLNTLSANPYREGMKRLKAREGSQPTTTKHRWNWPWSKE